MDQGQQAPPAPRAQPAIAVAPPVLPTPPPPPPVVPAPPTPLLKQIIILTMVDNPASTMHIREMLIESKRKLLVLKGNITELNQWVCKQMG